MPKLYHMIMILRRVNSQVLREQEQEVQLFLGLSLFHQNMNTIIWNRMRPKVIALEQLISHIEHHTLHTTSSVKHTKAFTSHLHDTS